MRNISEINLSLYCSYFLTEENSDVILCFNTSNGLVNVDKNEYDTFATEAGTIIAFKELNIGIQNYVYTSGSNRKYIQNVFYEHFQEIFNQHIGENLVLYSFMKSIEIPNKEEYTRQDGSLPDDFVRCDYNKFGSIPFYPALNPLSITKIINILDVCGTGHLLWICTKNTENPNRDSQSVNTGGRTLTGAIKGIYEWSEVYKSPFNNKESISKAANDFLEELQIPENVLNDIISTQVDMRVSRYLKGETRQVYSFDENTETPESLKNFMNSRCKYRSLYQLVNNHPRKNELSESIFSNYTGFIENNLYQIYINNNLDSFTPEFLKQYFETNVNKDSSTALKLLELLKEIE